MIIKFLMWLYLKVIGVRFHRLASMPTNKEYRHTHCVLYNGNTITFKFHIVGHEEYLYVRGRIKTRYTKSLLIHAEYDAGLPEEFRRWNNIAFSFPGVPIWIHKKRSVSEMMLMTYLDFIRYKESEPIS